MAKRHHMTSNGPIPFTEEEETKKDAEEAQWAIDKAEYDAQEYARNRVLAFSSIGIGDQLDMQYWDQVNGTTIWKDTVAKVKSDNPKPTE